jgi:hypothetical protein
MISVLKQVRWAQLLVGIALLLIAGAIGRFQGYHVRFGGPVTPGPDLSYVSPGEFTLWFSYILLLTPGSMLTAIGLGGAFHTLLGHGVTAMEQLSARALGRVAIVVSLLLWPTYRLLRWSVFRDHFLTDDEPVIQFGAQIWTLGHLSIPRPLPVGVVSELFTVTTNGRISSMDWPGGLAFAALGLVTRLGPWLYGLAAAVTLVFVVAAAGRLSGKRGALLAGAIWLGCPMVWTLSITEHTHIVSRACIALAFLACTRLWCAPDASAVAPKGYRWALIFGAAAGYSTSARPYETMAMLGPACAYFAWLALTERGFRLRQALLAISAALPFLLLYGAYNYELTGSPFLTPRALPWAADNIIPVLSPWQRAGHNLGHNLLQLGIWFFGVLGLPLAWLGFSARNAPHKVLRGLLFLGVVGQFAIALGHENVGIHSVGPIHYSETVVPLTLLATVGTLACSDWFSQVTQRSRPLLLHAVGYLGSVMAFSSIYLGSFQGVGRTSEVLPKAVRAAGLHHAVVMAQMPCWMERLVPRSHGTWQVAHAPPHPLLTDDIIYVTPEVPITTLVEQFPDRAIYQASYDVTEKAVDLSVIKPGPLDTTESDFGAAEARPDP